MLNQSSGPFPFTQVLKDEYASFHGGDFPKTYLVWSFYKDHIKDPAQFAIKLRRAKFEDDLDSLEFKLYLMVDKEAPGELNHYVYNVVGELAHISNDESVIQPPDSLQDVIVAQLNHLLQVRNLYESVDPKLVDQALKEFGGGDKQYPLEASVLKGDDIYYFNRILLETAFPADLYSVNDTLSGIYPHIHQKRHSALCLSGGGVGSTSFGLGVIQGLARYGLLDKFDYLSTAAEGSYLGSWLAAWIERHKDGIEGVVKDLSLRPGLTPDNEAKPVRYLRRTSGGGSLGRGVSFTDSWTLIIIFLRNNLLGLLLLASWAGALLMIPRLVVSVIRLPPGTVEMYALALSFLTGVMALSYIRVNQPGGLSSGDHMKINYRGSIFKNMYLYLVPLSVFVVLLTFLIGWRNTASELSRPYFFQPSGLYPEFSLTVAFGAILYLCAWGVSALIRKKLNIIGLFFQMIAGVAFGFSLWAIQRIFLRPDSQSMPAREYIVCFAPPMILLAFILSETIFRSLVSKWATDDDSAWWLRLDAWVMIVLAVWFAISTLTILGPTWLYNFIRSTPGTVDYLGGISGLVWIIAGLFYLLLLKDQRGTKPKPEISDKKIGFLNLRTLRGTVGNLIIICLLILLTSYATSLIIKGIAVDFYPSWANADHLSVVHQSPLYIVSGLTVVFIFFAVLLSFFISINNLSLFSIFRARLVRIYLRASDPYPTPEASKSNMPISKLQYRRPQLLVNLAVRLALAHKDRPEETVDEPFSATPLFTGNYWLGYRKSNEYGGNISLGTLATISSDESDTTRRQYSLPVFRLIENLLRVGANSQLGVWRGNPGPAGENTYKLDAPRFLLRPLIAEAFGSNDDAQPYVYLTSGRQVDKLGLFEMVLRRCSLIVVVDTTYDPEYKYSSIGESIRGIRTDLGVPIEFSDFPIYSKSAKRSGKYCAIGRIGYSAVDAGAADGQLIYIKPAFYGDEPVEIISYAKSNPQFPFETITPPRSSESQFESYRRLGSYTIERILSGAKPSTLDDFGRVVRLYLADTSNFESGDLVTRQIESLLAGPTLENYRGYICARFTDKQYNPLSTTEGSPRAEAGQEYLLQVWLQPDKEGVNSELVDIRGGKDVKEVLFSVRLDSDYIEFTPQRNDILVRPKEVSVPLEFRLSEIKKTGENKVWVQLYQKGRFVQNLIMNIEVIKRESSY